MPIFNYGAKVVVLFEHLGHFLVQITFLPYFCNVIILKNS